MKMSLKSFCGISPRPRSPTSFSLLYCLVIVLTLIGAVSQALVCSLLQPNLFELQVLVFSPLRFAVKLADERFLGY